MLVQLCVVSSNYDQQHCQHLHVMGSCCGTRILLKLLSLFVAFHYDFHWWDFWGTDRISIASIYPKERSPITHPLWKYIWVWKGCLLPVNKVHFSMVCNKEGIIVLLWAWEIVEFEWAVFVKKGSIFHCGHKRDTHPVLYCSWQVITWAHLHFLTEKGGASAAAAGKSAFSHWKNGGGGKVSLRGYMHTNWPQRVYY